MGTASCSAAALLALMVKQQMLAGVLAQERPGSNHAACDDGLCIAGSDVRHCVTHSPSVLGYAVSLCVASIKYV